jgi:hypothetical protein
MATHLLYMYVSRSLEKELEAFRLIRTLLSGWSRSDSLNIVKVNRMKISRCLLTAAMLASLLSAQTSEERKRFQEIQERHKRGEQINDADMEVISDIDDEILRRCAANLRNVVTAAKARLERRAAGLRLRRLEEVCSALRFSLACD